MLENNTHVQQVFMSSFREGGFVCDKEALRSYSISTLSKRTREVLGVIFATTQSDVVTAITLANKYKVPIYPISTGKNWGFGSGSPVNTGCIILDLSRMRTILFLDEKLGVVTVEPGVTFAQLAEFIQEHAPKYIAPVTGAGGEVSVLANLLEKGRSESGLVDRVSTLLSCSAVLADGSLYTSQSGGEDHPFYHAWGSGAYLDGLFLQSNFGVVISVSIKLALHEEKISVLYIGSNDLSVLVACMSNLQLGTKGFIPSLRISHKNRTVARIASEYPRKKILPFSKTMSIDDLYYGDEPEWTLVGVVASTSTAHSAVKKAVIEVAKKMQLRVWFFNAATLSMLSFVVKHWKSLYSYVYLFRLLPIFFGYLQSARGVQFKRSDLPVWKKALVYKVGEGSVYKDRVQYEHPDTGFIFVHGVLPFDENNITAFHKKAYAVCDRYGIEYLGSYSSLTSTSVRVTIPLVFNKQEVNDVHIMSCYDELENALVHSGGILDRRIIDSMGTVESLHKNLYAKIKKALDQEGIVAPGRYA
jgi:hypothetical protein